MALHSEAERSVLGSLLRDPAAVAGVRAMLRPADMGMPRHAAILRAIYAEHAATGATDPIAVGSRLGAQLDEAGGHAYLLDLFDEVVTGAGAHRHAAIVRAESDRRWIAGHAAELARAARDGAPMPELLSMLDAARPAPSVHEAWPGRAPADVLRRWRDEGPLVHVPTGIVALDEMTGGGPVLGTRIYSNGAPNAGKTALAVQVADTWAQCGLVVGILGIDEEPDDLLQRFLQRRGWSRQSTELRDSEELDRMERQVAELPIVFYSHGDTIESAGADLARRAKDAGKPAALFVDSIQSAAEGEDRKAAVAAAAASARVVASRYRMVVWCTSEMNRAAYRSAVAAAEQNGMAAGADSRSIEFQARVLLNLTSIAGSGDRIECRVVKNKLGRDHLPDEQGIVLHLNRATQELTEDTTFQVPAASKPKDAAKARERLQDQALLAELVARQPGLGTKDLEGAFRVRAVCGPTRFCSARYALGDAVVKLPGVRTEQLHYLDGAKVSEQVLRLVPVEFQGIVKASEPPSRTEPHSAAPSRTSAPRSTPSREAHQAPIGSRCVSSRGAGAGSVAEQPGECASGRTHGEAEGAA
ncbi:MAG: AAA family ATPase [Planctomycetes bacterium]|nr:AAA family ATPase [Planctomycetota bacterium]